MFSESDAVRKGSLRTINRSVLSMLVCSVLPAPVMAAAVVSWELGDFVNGDGPGATAGSDQLISDMRLFGVPSGSSSLKFGATGETNCTNSPTAPDCAPIPFDQGAVDIDYFTTGFNFGGTGELLPFFSGNVSADITGNTLTLTEFPFAFKFLGATGTVFPNDPEVLQNCTGQVGCGTSPSMGYDALVVPLGGNDYAVRLRYVSIDTVQTGPTHQFHYNWRLEGRVSVVPLPPAIALLGSGLIGLVSFASRRRRISP